MGLTAEEVEVGDRALVISCRALCSAGLPSFDDILAVNKPVQPLSERDLLIRAEGRMVMFRT